MIQLCPVQWSSPQALHDGVQSSEILQFRGEYTIPWESIVSPLHAVCQEVVDFCGCIVY